jgi:signal transduction histidine kinase
MNDAPESVLSGPAQQGLAELGQPMTGYLAASAEITGALLASTPEAGLDLVVRHARRLTAATMACVEVLDPPDHLLMQAADGLGDWMCGQMRPLEAAPLHREVMATGRAMIIVDAVQDGRGAAVVGPGGPPLGPALLMPLPTADRTFGALTIGAEPGHPPFTPLDIDTAALLAGYAALALELDRVQRHSLAASFDGSETVAQGLHDVVMQRLFAVGLQLQALASAVTGPVADKVTAAAASLDQTMADIRAAIFALRQVATEAAPGLRSALIEAATDAERRADG